jgi:hypothetical protein
MRFICYFQPVCPASDMDYCDRDGLAIAAQARSATPWLASAGRGPYWHQVNRMPRKSRELIRGDIRRGEQLASALPVQITVRLRLRDKHGALERSISCGVGTVGSRNRICRKQLNLHSRALQRCVRRLRLRANDSRQTRPSMARSQVPRLGANQAITFDGEAFTFRQSAPHASA